MFLEGNGFQGPPGKLFALLKVWCACSFENGFSMCLLDVCLNVFFSLSVIVQIWPSLRIVCDAVHSVGIPYSSTVGVVWLD